MTYTMKRLVQNAGWAGVYGHLAIQAMLGRDGTADYAYLWACKAAHEAADVLRQVEGE